MKKSQSKSKPKNEESKVQQRYFEEIVLASKVNWKYQFIHSHHYVRTSIGVMMKMKREGLRQGVADIEIPFPAHGLGALYIELKTKYTQQSPKQKKFQQYCARSNNGYAVCRNLEDALLITHYYLRPQGRHTQICNVPYC